MMLPAMRFRRSTRILALVLGAVALTMAIPGPGPGARAGTTHAVQIVDFTFAPASLTVSVGDTVTWTNLDSVAHTATSTSGAFDSGDLDQGESFSLTFTAAGSYDYLCTPHPTMTGRIVVEPAPAPPPTAAPATGGGIPNVAVPAPSAGLPMPVLIGLALMLAALIVAARTADRRSRPA
jgi:amicyanin